MLGYEHGCLLSFYFILDLTIAITKPKDYSKIKDISTVSNTNSANTKVESD